jgi:hypothetical protein
MRGLIEMAIEREAERLDEIMEYGNAADVPFFAPRYFRPVRSQTRRFAQRVGSRRQFSSRAVPSSHYAH